MSFTFSASSSAAAEQSTTASAPLTGNLFGSATTSSSTPTFNFGQTDTPGASGGGGDGGLFGNTVASQSSQKSLLFGNNAASTSSSATPMFGAQTSGPSGGGLFSQNKSSGSGSSLFANRAGTSTPTSGAGGSGGGSNIFGNAAAPTSIGTSTTNIFSNLGGQSSVDSTPAFEGSFGQAKSSTPASTPASQTTPSKPMFTLQSTTPAGVPPTTEAAKFKSLASTSSMFAHGFKPSPLGPGVSGDVSKPSLVQTGGLFGNVASSAPSTTKHAAAPATAAPVSSLFDKSTDGPTFGASTGNAPTMAAATTSAAPKPIFSSLNASTTVPISKEVATNNLFSAAKTNTTAPASNTTLAPTQSGLFGGNSASSSAAAPASTTASTLAGTSAPTNSLFGTTTTSPAATGTSSSNQLASSTMGPPSQLPRLKNKTMDEIITRWGVDLQKYRNEFKDQATKISEWDRTLVQNGEKIQKLYTSTFEAEKASTEIERQLANVESQQDELSSWLDRYESDLDELAAKQGGVLNELAGPDQERENTYKLAERLTDRLDDMGMDLAKMIKEINDMSGSFNKGSKPDDPLSQIVRVLNGHLSQLQWIDTNTAALQAKVSAAQKASTNIGSSYGGSENDAAESFCRSYMGRK